MSDQDAPTQKQLPHSGFGIASLVINLTAVLMMIEPFKGGAGLLFVYFRWLCCTRGICAGCRGLIPKRAKEIVCHLGIYCLVSRFFPAG